MYTWIAHHADARIYLGRQAGTANRTVCTRTSRWVWGSYAALCALYVQRCCGSGSEAARSYALSLRAHRGCCALGQSSVVICRLTYSQQMGSRGARQRPRQNTNITQAHCQHFLGRSHYVKLAHLLPPVIPNYEKSFSLVVAYLCFRFTIFV